MDLPSQMPLSRYSKAATCPLAASVFGVPGLHLHARCKYSCSASAAPLQLAISHSSFCWRHAWSDKRTLNSLESSLNDGRAFSATVDSGGRFKILSGHLSRFQTNGSKVERQESISVSETGRLVASDNRTKPSKLTEILRVSEYSGKAIKRLKRELHPPVDPSGINTGNKSLKSPSLVSETVNDTASQNSLSSRENSCVTGGILGSPKISQTSLGLEINADEVRMKMESVEKLSDQYGIKLSKRKKKKPEEVVTFVRLNLCSRYADLHGALEIYDKAKRTGVLQLTQHCYNVLLYICSGAASGSLIRGKSGRDEKNSETATPPPPKSKQINKGIEKSMIDMHLKHSTDALFSDPVGDSEASNPDVVYFTPEEMDLAARRGMEIYEDMSNADVPFNEATYTAIARLAVAKGDADLAFEIVKRMAAENIAPKLRSYGPALLSFCEKNEIQKAFEVDDHMLAAGVLPDEVLLEALLKISSEAGLEDKVYYMLQRLRRTVRQFSPTTVKTIERWFNSESAACAGRVKLENLPSKEELKLATEAVGGGWHGLGWLSEGKWNVRRTNISKRGSCRSCGEQLCTIDIDPAETENFAKSVAELACQREQKANDFTAFQDWLDCHGPFDAVIDGANIGLYNPKFSQGFNFHQLMAVVKAIRARIFTDKPPLIIVHCRHTKDRVSFPRKVQEVLDRWIRAKAIYLTPKGSNDDWYWLYAAVKSKCLLVTNDEMRDHLFQLLGNDFFPKWKERHQVRFTLETTDLELHMPPPYSILMQESINGSWHIPQIGGDDINTPREWLCVTKPDPVTLIPTSVDQVAWQPEEFDTVSKGGLMSSKLLKVDVKNPSQEEKSLTSSGGRTDVCSPASRSPSHALHAKRKRAQPPSHSSTKKTILKLEAAEELAESAIDFQI